MHQPCFTSTCGPLPHGTATPGTCDAESWPKGTKPCPRDPPTKGSVYLSLCTPPRMYVHNGHTWAPLGGHGDETLPATGKRPVGYGWPRDVRPAQTCPPADGDRIRVDGTRDTYVYGPTGWRLFVSDENAGGPGGGAWIPVTPTPPPPGHTGPWPPCPDSGNPGPGDVVLANGCLYHFDGTQWLSTCCDCGVVIPMAPTPPPPGHTGPWPPDSNSSSSSSPGPGKVVLANGCLYHFDGTQWLATCCDCGGDEPGPTGATGPMGPPGPAGGGTGPAGTGPTGPTLSMEKYTTPGVADYVIPEGVHRIELWAVGSGAAPHLMTRGSHYFRFQCGGAGSEVMLYLTRGVHFDAGDKLTFTTAVGGSYSPPYRNTDNVDQDLVQDGTDTIIELNGRKLAQCRGGKSMGNADPTWVDAEFENYSTRRVGLGSEMVEEIRLVKYPGLSTYAPSSPFCSLYDTLGSADEATADGTIGCGGALKYCLKKEVYLGAGGDGCVFMWAYR